MYHVSPDVGIHILLRYPMVFMAGYSIIGKMRPPQDLTTTRLVEVAGLGRIRLELVDPLYLKTLATYCYCKPKKTMLDVK